MRDDTTGNATALLLWERTVIRALVGGIGMGLALLFGIAVVYLYQSRPKGWDRNGIRALQPKTATVDLSAGLMSRPSDAEQSEAGAASTAKEQPQSSDTRLAGVLAVDLQNTTDADTTLSQSIIVMESEEGSQVLHDSKFRLDHDYFLPARHSVSVTLRAQDPCAPENTPEVCVESYFHGVDEIVLFDKPAGYEVHIPIKSIRLLRVEPQLSSEAPAKVPQGGTTALAGAQHQR